MEKENLSFIKAVEFIAKQHNIPVEYIQEERNDEQIAEAKHKEALLTALDSVQGFFVENLRHTDNGECSKAREYAYGRWTEEFCSMVGIAMHLKTAKRLLSIVNEKYLMKNCCMN